METTFTKLIYAGIGLANEAAEKIEKKVDELAKKGETTDWEARKIVDNIVKKTGETNWAEKRFNEVIGKFGYAKNTEVTELRKKIEQLETLAGEKIKTTAVKTAVK